MAAGHETIRDEAPFSRNGAGGKSRRGWPPTLPPPAPVPNPDGSIPF